jgi:hypothetical protein
MGVIWVFGRMFGKTPRITHQLEQLGTRFCSFRNKNWNSMKL